MDGNAPRGPPSGTGLGGKTQPGSERRRPPGGPGGTPSSASSGTNASGQSRAERFDDERRRITQSCFAKVDAQGQLVESYITHIRVQEDSAYPQAPPPPGGNPANKKSRVIIVSVRATGRVRLHKARENANGTFSIGKTWNMEELSAVENYVYLNPATEEEAQRQRYAAGVGFTVTIQKPYYWEAGTPKEKEFFISSMVKIFHKYTQGDFPVLTGFSAAELNSLTGGRPHLATPEAREARRKGTALPLPRPSQSTAQLTPKSPGMPAQQNTPPPGERRLPPSRDERRPPAPLTDGRGTPISNTRMPQPNIDEKRVPSRGHPIAGEEDRRPPPRRPPTAEGERRPPPLRGPPPARPRDAQSTSPLPPFAPGADTQRRPNPRPSMDQVRPSFDQGGRPSQSRERTDMRNPPSREQMDMRSPPSREQLRPMQVPGTSTPPPARLTPQSPRSEFPLMPGTPDSGSVPPMPAGLSPAKRPQPDDARSATSQRSQEEPSLDIPGVFPGEQRKPNGFPFREARPGTAQSYASSAFSRNDESPAEPSAPRSGPPERRRPPMLVAQTSQQSLSQSIRSEPRADAQGLAQAPAPLSVIDSGRRSEQSDRPRTAASQRGQDPVHASLPSEAPPTSPLPELPRPLVVPQAPPPAIETQPSIETDARSVSPEKPTSPTDEGEHRPGLGPMVKKKDAKVEAANAFRKAAFAAGAFKPRAGGAAAKLFAKESKTSDEPDGISGVFVPQRQAPKEEVENVVEVEKRPEPEPEPESEPEPTPIPQDLPTAATDSVPSVMVSGPLSPTPVVATLAVQELLTTRSPSPDKSVLKAEPEAEVRRKKRRSNHQIMNISKLGIDPSILDDRGLEFENLLSEFGWGGSELSAKNIETLEHDIRSEIARVEAGSWLNHLEQKDDRVDAVEKMLDRAIAECDELEGLLTLYNVELSSLNDDIAFIEAQGQGLQVQTANQRLLQNELQQLVETISITSDQLEPLRQERIGKISGLQAIESALVLLYKALITIDPAFVEASRASTGEMSKITSNSGFGHSELATMHALQEKKDRYLRESAAFLDRLKQHMTITFGAALLQTKDLLKNIDRSTIPSSKANVDAHDAGRRMLWMYSPLVLFTKEINRASWEEMIRMYQTQAGPLYQDEVRENIMSWKRLGRKPNGEEQDLLFTAQEKEAESIALAARKLTVKRSQTLARGLRTASGEKEGKAKVQTGKLHVFDVFGKALDDISPLLLTEQNFITDFFHATSTDSVDFPEAVSAASPENRRSTNLWARKPFEADRVMAKRVAEVMEDIFQFWPTELQNLVEWAIKLDPLQGVGILCAVDRKLYEIEDSNQDFMMKTLQKVHERLTGLFIKFVDEQIRAIEDTKVKIKKRKGVIRFINTFPHFSVAIENMLPAPGDETQLEIRRMVDDAYQKINKAMFESLKVIAKESPTVMATHGQGDPEDKAALNYHILLIENMNHYIEEVDARSDPVLLSWKAKADEEMREHMARYVDAVIRRPLGKLLEFIESTETILAQANTTAQSIAQRSSHSRSVFKKLIHSNDAKELRKGIEALKKRVDKHFGDADDQTIARNLVAKVFVECEKYYVDVCERTEKVCQDVYTGDVEMDWGVAEIKNAFRR